MNAQVLSTVTIAGTMREQIKGEVETFKKKSGVTPGLLLLTIGENSSIIDFVRVVARQAGRVGIRAAAHIMSGDSTAAEVREQIEELNQKRNLHGIALQVPLPPHLSLTQVASFIRPEKDVEALHPLNSGYILGGSPIFGATPALAGLKILSLFSINPAGKHIVIIGRGPVIGRPLAGMLTAANATVTVCHTKTPDLAAFTRQADIIIVAAPTANLLTPPMVKSGAVVIDYGINYVNGRVVGSVDFAGVSGVASAITPMPGGTGPLTVIALLQNTLKAATIQLERAQLPK